MRLEAIQGKYFLIFILLIINSLIGTCQLGPLNLGLAKVNILDKVLKLPIFGTDAGNRSAILYACVHCFGDSLFLSE